MDFFVAKVEKKKRNIIRKKNNFIPKTFSGGLNILYDKENQSHNSNY